MISPNALFEADCLNLLQRLDDKAAVLVYLDPPWTTTWQADLSQGSEADLRDKYLSWFSQVLQQAFRIVSPRGNIVIHLEPTLSSYARLMIEEAVEKVDFVEFVLEKTRQMAAPIDRRHEFLLLCRVSPNSVYTTPTRPLTKDEIASRYSKEDSRGLYTLNDLTSPGERKGQRYEWHGYVPPAGRAWRFTQATMDSLESEGRIHIPAGGKLPYLKHYVSDSAEVAVGTVWTDISLRLPSAERTGRAAQQPLALLERVVKMASNEGDLVVDPFCGSGTCVLAAQILGRKWLACDSDKEACDLTAQRLESIKAAVRDDYHRGSRAELLALPVVADTRSLGGSRLFQQQVLRYVLNKPIPLEETRQYEFKEVKGNNPVGSIESVVDEYAVAFLNSEGGRILWGVRNEDRIAVGVHLDYRQRDEVRKGIDNKLRQIQPPVAPSGWRVELHEVFDEARLVPDLYVIELVVPRGPQPGFLYATGKGDFFVKTDSGKKKLSPVELQEEIRARQGRV